MAMDANQLGTQIAAAIQALSEDDLQDLESVWTAIAGAFIQHIQTNATIKTINIDLSPTNGVPDGETITTTGVIE